MSFALLRSGSPCFRGLATVTVLLGVSALAVPVQAQVTVTTTVFSGTLNESFESFPNYNTGTGGISPLANPTVLFGGDATLSGTNNIIYEPNQGALFALGNNGTAQVAGGTKALGLNSASYTATLTFNTSLTQFGGYFNATRTDTVADTVTFTFFDAANMVIDTKSLDINPTNTSTGTLNFYGFLSPTAFKSVAITGSYIAADSLRATAAQSPVPIPEPVPLALLLPTLPLAAACLRRRLRH